MSVFNVLFPIALILVFSKLLQMGCKKIHFPQVVGMLLAGILIMLLGLIPGVDGILFGEAGEGKTGIKFLAEIGVVLIMFSAGLETNVNTIKQSGISAFIVTLLGVIVPMAFGFVVAGLFQGFSGTTTINGMTVDVIWSNLFYGVILTATSVSVTVATLKEMGRLSGKAGTIITCAAILDDIIGVVILSIILSLAGGASSDEWTLGSLMTGSNPDLSILAVILDVILFFIVIIVLGILARKIFNYLNSKKAHKRRVPIFALGFAFLMAWMSERLFGIADITGAFFAGLFLSGIGHHINPALDALDNDTSDYIERKSDVLSYMLFTPIFFANVGINIKFDSFNPSIIGLGLCFIVAGLAGKVLGCGLGAKITKNSWKDSVRIGVGMMARAEVALICATKGMDANLVDSGMSVFIVIMIVVSSFVTPLILKLTYKNEEPVKEDYKEESFTAINETVIETPLEGDHIYVDHNMEP